MKKPLFNTLKTNYRTQSTQIHNCTMHFPNTCAIRMSEALVRTDENFLDVFIKSNKNKCPDGYIRGAQDLAAILRSPSAFGTHNLGWSSQPTRTPPENVIGKRGIICYMNIPGFSGQGHIDLWDKTVPVGDSYWDAKTIWMWTL
ncbi:T6SS effector amidase Tae4 family protein [Photobacterium kasasachensis]|uniref:T6SS effector amidase Tae4 family protein n=1 Tax=Photobacterium kasasachensis TaxID=2910240 RepID=UPI003D0EB55B